MPYILADGYCHPYASDLNYQRLGAWLKIPSLIKDTVVWQLYFPVNFDNPAAAHQSGGVVALAVMSFDKTGNYCYIRTGRG